MADQCDGAVGGRLLAMQRLAQRTGRHPRAEHERDSAVADDGHGDDYLRAVGSRQPDHVGYRGLLRLRRRPSPPDAVYGRAAVFPVGNSVDHLARGFGQENSRPVRLIREKARGEALECGQLGHIERMQLAEHVKS